MSLIPSGRRLSRTAVPAWAARCAFFVVFFAAAPLAQAEDEKPAQKAEETKAADTKAEGKSKKSEPAAEQKAAPAKEPVRNPLVDLIKKGLNPGKGQPAAPQPPNAPNSTQRSSDRNLADPTAPYDRAATTWMTRAIAHAKANEWKQALELLQRVTDQPEDSLFRTEAGKWVSIHVEADRRRGEAPAEVLAEYRAQYEGLARQLLNEAIKSGTPAAFGRVARGYFHTDAGREAADRLGSLHLNRGEFALASYWFAALWQAKTKVTQEPLWRTKAAYAFKQAGQAELTAELTGSPAADGNPISLGGRRRDLAKWLAEVPLLGSQAELPLKEWLTFLGSPRRTGVAVGGDPLLLPRWRVPLTTSHPANQQIEQLTEDLADGGIHAPLILQPAMTGGRIAFRTLHGVQVVEAATGRSLWHTEEEQPIEKLVMGSGPGSFDFGGNLFAGNPVAFRRPALVRRMGAWSNGGGFSGSGEYSPLCHLLYRNAAFGLISSDGKRLFVVDDPFALTNRQPGNAFQGDANGGGAEDDGSQLTAYDLETGRPMWQVGGPANGEPFDPPLAGYFFFGPPVADGGELLVVAECTAGERAKQIRLLSLDPQTGTERWSQLLAYSDLATIDKDVGRRWWAAPVATENGIVICPTTVGWLIAVDRVTRSLLWGYRAHAPGAANSRANMPTAQVEAMAMVQNTPLNGTWSQSPPILAGGKIIWTPMESGNLVCIDQFSGKELWTKPRQNQIYVAGVHQGKVVVVGREATTAYDLGSGTQAWSVKTGNPSGRGVATSDRYLLPVSTGEVVSINLADGTIAQQSRLPANVRGVGNLTLYNGMLLSLDTTGLTAFEQRDAVREEIAQRKAANPHDPQALIREAEIALLGREYSAAIESLRGIERSSVPADMRERLRQLKIQTLQGAIRSDLSGAEVESRLNELAEVSTTAEEKRGLHRLQTDLYLHQKAFDKAFDAYLELLSAESNLLVARDEHSSTSTRERLWVAGKITDLFALLAPDERPKFDRRVSAMAQQALKGGVDAQERFVEVLGDHPESVVVRRQLVESLAKAGNLTRAEHHLRRLERSYASEVAAAAMERRARLMRQFDLTADAGLAYSQLERQYGDVVLSGNRKARELVRELRDTGKFPIAGSPVVDWQATSIRIERSGAAHTSYVPQELASTGSEAAYFQENRIELDQGSQRLSVTDAGTDELQWELPLRTHAGSHDGQPASARSAGHLLVLLHRGVLQCLAPVERKVLWSRPLDERQAAQGYYGRNTNPIQPMQASISLTNRQVYNQQMGGGWGSLAVANDEIIICQGRRQLTVFDTQTGDVRWTFTGIRPGAAVFGGRETVYVRPADGQNCVALRALDGKRLEVANLGEVLNRAVDSVDDSFVMPLTGGRPGLRLFDPLTNRESWKTEYAKGTLIYPLEHDRLAILETAQNSGTFYVLDLVSGSKTQLGSVTSEELKGRNEVFAFSDNQNIYLVINKGTNRNYNSEQIPYVRTNGTVFAFDPAQKRLRWKQVVTAQNLILERLEYSPMVLFAARTYETQGKLRYWSLHLVAVDKLSGAKLLDDKSASQTGFRSVNISAGDRFIELRGYNDRVRLYPVEASAAAGEAGD